MQEWIDTRGQISQSDLSCQYCRNPLFDYDVQHDTNIKVYGDAIFEKQNEETEHDPFQTVPSPPAADALNVYTAWLYSGAYSILTETFLATLTSSPSTFCAAGNSAAAS